MLSAEQNELITRTNPGTKAGNLLRRYWQPAALVDELSGNRPIKPVKLMGENLVMFKDGQGRYGLIARGCPHRGTDLAFGRLEADGLRCAVPRLEIRRQRHMSGDSCGAGRQQPLRQYPSEVLSGGGEERHPVRLYGPGRAAGVSRISTASSRRTNIPSPSRD